MRLVITLLAAALLAGPATAQRTQTEKQPGVSKQQKQTKQKVATKSKGMTFAKKAAIGGMYEVQAGELAQDKAQRDDVKQAAQTIVTDHEKANDELKSVLGENASALPTSLDRKHARMIDQLQRASGQQFDRLFIQQQLQAHREAISLFRNYARRGDNPELKQFAQETLPTLEHHLQMVQELRSGGAVAAKKTNGKRSSATGAGAGTGGSRK